MTKERSYPEIANNYMSIAGHFAVFGVFVAVLRALGLQDANAYLIAMPLFAAASVAFNRLKPALTRGFTPLCVGFLACTLAFPAVKASCSRNPTWCCTVELSEWRSSFVS